MRNRIFRTVLSPAILAAALAAFAPIAANAANLHVRNDSGRTIAYLYISPSENEYFSSYDQMLGPSQYIRPGETWTIDFRGGGNCDFDLRAVYTDGYRAERDDVDFCSTGDDQWLVWTLY